MKNYNLIKKFLLKEYIKNKKSSIQIAKEIKCSPPTILNHLKRFNIKIRTISESRKGKLNPNYIDGRTNKKYNCIDCDKEISETSALYGQGRCHSCENKRRHDLNIINVKEENNPNYIHGKAYEPYSSKFNESLKELIRNRDNRKCQLCGCPEIECNRKLDVHHIDYDKKNCKKENLISLCIKCNYKVNFNRDYWFSYFTYIMENSYVSLSEM